MAVTHPMPVLTDLAYRVVGPRLSSKKGVSTTRLHSWLGMVMLSQNRNRLKTLLRMLGGTVVIEQLPQHSYRFVLQFATEEALLEFLLRYNGNPL